MSTFYQILHEMEEDPHIKGMRQYGQHARTNTYEHCHHVAIYSYLLARRLGWDIDERALVRGAFLHDYYGYDVRAEHRSAYRHGTQHAQAALDNALQDFELSEKEKNIIYSHMWPLNLTHVPRSREAFLVSLSDKICAWQEVFLWKRKASRRRLSVDRDADEEKKEI